MQLGLGLGLGRYRGETDFAVDINKLFKNTQFYLKLDETSGEPINSIDGSLGLSFGGVQKGVQGKINTAYEFDGVNSYLRFPNPNLFNADSIFAFRSWFKTTSTQENVIATLYQGSGLGEAFTINIDNGSVKIAVLGGNVVFGSGFNDGNLHRVVINVPQNSILSEVECYVDNIKLNIVSIADRSLNPVSTDIVIGQFSDTRFYSGVIDEVCLDINKNLTLEEINEDWNNGEGVTYFPSPLPQSDPSIPTPLNNTFDIYLVGGQSNMAGRSKTTESGTPVYLQNNVVNGVYSFNGISIDENYSLLNNGQNGTGADYITNDAKSSNAFAPKEVTLKLLSNTAENSILMCQVTEGSTGLGLKSDTRGNWSVDYNDFPSDTPKLTQILNQKFDNLISYLQSNNINYNVKALVWHQGEDDRVSPHNTNYLTNFTNFISEVRSFTLQPNLPIIYGTIPNSSASFDQIVKDAQLNYAANDSNAFCRVNDDLTLRDTVHFDAPSNVIFGEWIKNIITDNTIQ